MNEIQIIDVKKIPADGSFEKLPFSAVDVPAGFPSTHDEHIDKVLDLHELLVTHPAATFFVKVVGDSMQGARIFSGDILIVDRALQASNGKVVVAIVDGAFTVKRFIITQKGAKLVSENPRFPESKYISLSEDSDVRIWGVVTYVIHTA